MKFNIVRKISKIWIAEPKTRNKVLAVEIKSNHGIGAKLVWALQILSFCEKNKLTPQLKFTYPDSIENEDYFKSFFDLKTHTQINVSAEFTQIQSINELSFISLSFRRKLDLKLASQLINKYLIIKDDVLSEVDDFCFKHFADKKVLGVHYRGTDKSSEAPSVSYENVERNINFYLEKFPKTDTVFVSSDDSNFIKYIENCSIPCSIIYRNDVYRSEDNDPIHYSDQNKYDINRDAIINCLILSRCDALMKTASILSAWSKLFNPKLPLIMLNKPYENCRWFPEKELLNHVLYDPVE